MGVRISFARGNVGSWRLGRELIVCLNCIFVRKLLRLIRFHHALPPQVAEDDALPRLAGVNELVVNTSAQALGLNAVAPFGHPLHVQRAQARINRNLLRRACFDVHQPQITRQRRLELIRGQHVQHHDLAALRLQRGHALDETGRRQQVADEDRQPRPRHAQRHGAQAWTIDRSCQPGAVH